METGLVFSGDGFAANRSYEYLLALDPPEEIHNMLNEEKNKFSSENKVTELQKTMPFMTLAGFTAKEGMEETIIKWMQRIISTQAAFDVTLNNYSGFPRHTIYVRVQDHAPFKQIAASLKVIDQFVQGNGCPPAVLATRPYLPIATQLQQAVYERAMFEYSRKTFHAGFTVQELPLLRRQNHFDTCRKVNVFKLAAAVSRA